MFWTIIGSFAALLTTFSFVPQIVKVSRNKSVKDVSVLTLFQFSAGVTLWAIYGFHLRNWIIIIANIITLGTLLVLITQYFNFKKVN